MPLLPPRRKSDNYSFADVLQIEGLAGTYLDTYATRTLVHSAPCNIRALSAIRAGPEKFLQRCAVPTRPIGGLFRVSKYRPPSS